MSNVTLPVCVTLNKSGMVIMRTGNPQQIMRLEGNWYFHPSLRDESILKVTDRLYHCPYKGVANWIDLEISNLYIPDIAWVYPHTLPDYEHIAGWTGFYPQTVHYKTGACES